MVRERLWKILEPAARDDDGLSRLFDAAMSALIAANVIAVIVGTVEAVHEAAGAFLDAFERLSVAAFTIEYAARLASCTVDRRFQGALRGRVRWAATPMAIIDLAAILPAYLPLLGLDLRVARIFRLVRLVRLAKLARYVHAFQVLGAVARDKREELIVMTALMVGLLVLSSSLMFYAEHEAQPAAYPDIPSTMWWAVATLTTVGYGDVYPVTPVGKVLGGLVAILGIAFFALPTAVLGAGFVDEIQRRRRIGGPVIASSGHHARTSMRSTKWRCSAGPTSLKPWASATVLTSISAVARCRGHCT